MTYEVWAPTSVGFDVVAYECCATFAYLLDAGTWARGLACSDVARERPVVALRARDTGQWWTFRNGEPVHSGTGQGVDMG